MKRITHTIDSQKLIEFLQKFPDRWHEVKQDTKTRKALDRAMALHPGKITVVTMSKKQLPQMRYHEHDWKLGFYSKSTETCYCGAFHFSKGTPIIGIEAK